MPHVRCLSALFQMQAGSVHFYASLSGIFFTRPFSAFFMVAAVITVILTAWQGVRVG